MHRHRRSVPVAFALSLLAVVLGASTTLGLTWGTTRRVSEVDSANAWPYALIAVTARVFTAYREVDDEDRHIAFRRSLDGGATFSDPVELSRPEAVSSYQAALGYGGGVLHASWVEATDAGEQALYRRSANSGASWSDSVVMTPPEVEGVASPRVFASGATAFFVYTDAITGQIWIRRSTDGGATWKSSIAISSDVWTDPHVAAVGSSAVVSYSWYTGSANEYVAVRRTTNKGSTWTSRKRVSSGTSEPAFNSWVIRANGRWRLVYQRCSSGCDVTALWYRSSSDGVTWSSAQRFTASTAALHPVGLSYASTAKRIWVGWIAGPDQDASDFTFYARSGG